MGDTLIILLAVAVIAIATAYYYKNVAKNKDLEILRWRKEVDDLFNELSDEKKITERLKLANDNIEKEFARIADVSEMRKKYLQDYANSINELKSHNDDLQEKLAEVEELSKQEKIKVVKEYYELKNNIINEYKDKKANLFSDYNSTKANVISEFNLALNDLKQEKQQLAEREARLAQEREQEKQQLAEREARLAQEREQEKQQLAECEARLANKEATLLTKVKEIPVLAKCFADIEYQKDKIREEYLRYKERPAIKASNIVNEIRREKSELNIKLKEAEYRVKYYEQVVPWLAAVDDDYLDPELNKTGNTDFDNNKDAASFWLSKDEFTQLTSQEKYQLALERYKKRVKTNAEIGRDYERYVGYQYETQGYAVEYRGIVDGFEDRGRDLLCHRDGKTLVVQCKYWSEKKTIHENHINQLFGTTLKYFLEQHPRATFYDFFTALEKRTIAPVFVTSTTLSETAAEFASSLNISVAENKSIGDYPIIKCNINRSTGEKIYHLPFDQQYDKVKISGKGECYAMTVAEAEEKGFRRAKRWLGE
ncbi:restriction endonuclease [Phascolarctobacterium succinatutens]|uniref:restriction endonuclease n=1 Tax=Phascolarctobacterium succinatutens TaxID=626940 RepID=UPI003077D380